MEESGPHQAAIDPHQVYANLHQAESKGSQQREDHEGSAYTTHTSKSQSRGKSRVSHAKNDRDMQREIDERIAPRTAKTPIAQLRPVL